MIFLCFSSKDRYEIVESIYYHINNYSIPIWYDRHEILMGEDRNYKNFIEGVASCNYAVIILSPNAISSICANEEIDLIKKKFEKKEMYVFPVFYKIKAKDVPDIYNWMKKLVYKELDISMDSRGLCNHIVCKYLLDKITYCKYKTIVSIEKNSTGFINQLISSYREISGTNYNSRISILFSAILYINAEKELPDFCSKAANFLFNETKLNLIMDLRETIIFERLFIIAYDYFEPLLK